MKNKIARNWLMIFLLLAVVAGSGCHSVRRRLTITSDPPGATVYMNDQEIGRTPVSQNILYSGTYKIRCSKDSYETQTVMHKVRTPWYLYPGIDFFSENFVPGEITDMQDCHVVLPQKRIVPDNELLDAAAAMRTEAHSNTNLPATGLVR
ncbi:MAG: PEGA domain-containing protein [Planctomycetia bacterium]|nr:PEGA domain-containing protein [Planctomycetia bacterium]